GPGCEGLCLGRLGMALAALGQPREALACSQGAERLIGRLGDRVAMGVLRLFRAFIDACSHDSGALVERDRLAEAHAPAFIDRSSLVDLSDDARTAVRLLEATLAAKGARVGVLFVGPQARWFTAPGG